MVKDHWTLVILGILQQIVDSIVSLLEENRGDMVMELIKQFRHDICAMKSRVNVESVRDRVMKEQEALGKKPPGIPL